LKAGARAAVASWGLRPRSVQPHPRAGLSNNTDRNRPP